MIELSVLLSNGLSRSHWVHFRATFHYFLSFLSLFLWKVADQTSVRALKKTHKTAFMDTSRPHSFISLLEETVHRFKATVFILNSSLPNGPNSSNNCAVKTRPCSSKTCHTCCKNTYVTR